MSGFVIHFILKVNKKQIFANSGKIKFAHIASILRQSQDIYTFTEPNFSHLELFCTFSVDICFYI